MRRWPSPVPCRPAALGSACRGARPPTVLRRRTACYRPGAGGAALHLMKAAEQSDRRCSVRLGLGPWSQQVRPWVPTRGYAPIPTPRATPTGLGFVASGEGDHERVARLWGVAERV